MKSPFSYVWKVSNCKVHRCYIYDFNTKYYREHVFSSDEWFFNISNNLCDILIVYLVNEL